MVLGVCAAGSSRNPGGLRRDARRQGVFRGRRAGDFRPAGRREPKTGRTPPPNAAIRTRFSVGGGRIHPLYAAISACRRLAFTARHTKSHSPRTCARPRRLKRRKPSTCLTQPYGALRQPLPLRIHRPPRRRRQLLHHPPRRRMPSPDRGRRPPCPPGPPPRNRQHPAFPGPPNPARCSTPASASTVLRLRLEPLPHLGRATPAAHPGRSRSPSHPSPPNNWCSASTAACAL